MRWADTVTPPRYRAPVAADETPADVAAAALRRIVAAMPEGLVNVLTKDDILDLLAYIESGGKREHAAFKP